MKYTTIALLAGLLLGCSGEKLTAGTIPNTKDTVYPASYITTQVFWVGDSPTVAGFKPTGFSDVDAYVYTNALHNAEMGREMGFKFETLRVPTPYAAYPINYKTGKMK